MQFQITSAAKFAALAILAASAAPSFAQSAGDTVVSAGWAHIAPQDSSTPLVITSPNIPGVAGPKVGSGASVDPTNTLEVSIDRFLTDNWVASLDIGVPPTYKLIGTGTFAPIGQIGTAKQWAPALLGKYYFGTAQTAFRPILGLGIAHVSYSDVSLSNSFQTYGQQQGFDSSAVSTAKLGSSWVPVFNAGASYAIDKDWYASFTVSYVKLKTTADLTINPTLVGSVQGNTTLTLNPIVLYAAIGYRF
ncbi:OmpW/AlkL family protein [Solimicrobium silvestre]|uniref:Outer membrane protein W n=1 Tax=Solimicrobium silvestre TaxID=2099400 RepID=A0A2S9GVE7_9BURK|nr:OmpW family outer membrane protein [Solimicrobium silvestre]PRC91681.1 Outer membrane protein W [Solimicrobium silvestre]